MPRNARIRYNLGLLLQQLGRLEEATTALEGAVAIEPRSADLLFALGDHYLRRGRADDALTVAERLTAVVPDHPAGQQLKAAAQQSGAGVRGR
jgi:tetratricopeptide (TPR) repeat protein